MNNQAQHNNVQLTVNVQRRFSSATETRWEGNILNAAQNHECAALFTERIYHKDPTAPPKYCIFINVKYLGYAEAMEKLIEEIR